MPHHATPILSHMSRGMFLDNFRQGLRGPDFPSHYYYSSSDCVSVRAMPRAPLFQTPPHPTPPVPGGLEPAPLGTNLFPRSPWHASEVPSLLMHPCPKACA